MNVVSQQKFQIGPAIIAEGEPVYVVAEIGVNHNGRVGVARELIHAAVDAEVDAVKFQVFSPERLVRRDAPSANYQKQVGEGDSQYEMLSRLTLTHDQFAELAMWAGECGLEFLATPFAVEDLEFLVSIGVRAIKLASPDIVNVPLIESAAATRLPVIASTGAADLDEIAAAVNLFKGPDKGPLALLHCISSYPTPEWEANLAAIETLNTTFGCPSGFSDHTESTTIGGYAAAAGARIIEKHMTLDRSSKGPDHAFSLEPKAMAEYVRGIRHAETLLGQGRLGMIAIERDVRRLARGSLVAARDIHVGEKLTEAMLRVKRPADGVSPDKIASLLGRQAKTEIAADTPIALDAIS